MGGSADEFPLLSALGLYAADIRGDGNCLFNALSDQLYGHQNEHHAIRARVIEYMREHANYYKQFIDVHPGGGVRRNPKRKNVGSYSSPGNNALPPSEADIDRVFESHLQSMARGGTYGDNMEITAFSSAFDVDVKIYQRDFAYMVTGDELDKPRGVAHIAYHMWEHYSSIRNLDGPHSGLPQVQQRALSPEEEQKHKAKLAQSSHVMPWMIDAVTKSLPFFTDKPTVKRTLEACKGNVNDAVSKLLDQDEGWSASSAPESSSVEREPDSDDEALNGPNKKRDRRSGRAIRQLKQHEPQRTSSKLATHDASPESVASDESEASSEPTLNDPPKTEGTQDVIHVKGHDSTKPEVTARPSPRIRLNPGKPPNESEAARLQEKRVNPQRLTARDKRDMKKQAQKAARKERHQTAAKERAEPSMKAGIALRSKSLTATPPIESGFRTLFI